MKRLAIYFLFSLVPIRFFAEKVKEGDETQSRENKKDNFFTINSIEVRGVEDKKKQDNILLCFGKKVGDVFNLDDYSFLNTAKENILSKCTFVDDYTLTYSTDNDAISLYINVTIAPLITDIVTHKVKFSNDELCERLKKEYANEFVLQQLREACIDSIDTAEAELVIKTKDNESGTCIDISKLNKKKTFINNVSFEGNTQITSKELLSSLLLTGKDISVITFLQDAYASLKLDTSFLKDKSQKLLGFFLPKNKKTLSKNFLQKDLNTILEKYYSSGFLNAKIKQLVIEYDEENNYCDITYVIEEGERFYVGDYEVSDTKSFSSFDLKNALRIKPGDVFNLKAIREKVFGTQENMYLDGIKALFNRAGYNNCSFIIKITKVVGNKVYFHVDIREGTKELVGEIIVKGNVNTSFEHIINSCTMLPNTFFSSLDIMRTQQNLAQKKILDSKNPPVVIPMEEPTRWSSHSLYKNIILLIKERSFIDPKAGEIRFTYLNNLWFHFLPIGTLSFILSNINLSKLFHLWDKKVSWLGNEHDLSFSFQFNFMDKNYDWFWYGLFDVSYYIPEIQIFGHKFSHSANIKINALPPTSKEKKEFDKNNIKVKIKNIVVRELTYSFSLSFGTSINIFGRPWSLSFFPLSIKISSDFETRKMENILVLRHKTFINDFYVYKGVDFKISLYMPTILGSVIGSLSPSKLSFKSKKCLILYHSHYFNPYKDFVAMYSITAGLSAMDSCFDIKSAYQTDGTWGDSYTHFINVISFYIRGMNSDDSTISVLHSLNNNFAVKFNCELRYLVLEKVLFNIYLYTFVNNGYAGNIKDIKKIVSNSFSVSTLYNILEYSGVGILVTLPLVGDFSLSVNFKDLFFTMTYGVEHQNI